MTCLFPTPYPQATRHLRFLNIDETYHSEAPMTVLVKTHVRLRQSRLEGLSNPTHLRDTWRPPCSYPYRVRSLHLELSPVRNGFYAWFSRPRLYRGHASQF